MVRDFMAAFLQRCCATHEQDRAVSPCRPPGKHPPLEEKFGRRRKPPSRTRYFDRDVRRTSTFALLTGMPNLRPARKGAKPRQVRPGGAGLVAATLPGRAS